MDGAAVTLIAKDMGCTLQRRRTAELAVWNSVDGKRAVACVDMGGGKITKGTANEKAMR
jgi:hypothetical protein